VRVVTRKVIAQALPMCIERAEQEQPVVLPDIRVFELDENGNLERIIPRKADRFHSVVSRKASFRYLHFALTLKVKAIVLSK
jgi:hypothetical protein